MTTAGSSLLQQGAAAIGITITPEQLAAFDLFAADLVAWNRRINLTAITRPDEIIIKHFFDSLTLAPLLSGTESLLDVGSGAGFPAIPLKIVLPALSVVTVDAVQKKIHFQRHIIRALALTGITALHCRVETLATIQPGSFAVVTSRAFTSLVEFAELALPLLAPAGRIIAMKGPEGDAEAAAAADRLEQLGLVVAEIRHCTLPGGVGDRSLIVLQSTPAETVTVGG